MYRPQVFHTISERLPLRRTRAPKLDTESIHLYEELSNPTYDTVHLELAASLDKAECDPQLSEGQRAALKDTITTDAHDLACRMLPDDIVDLLDLTPKHPDNIGMESDAPSLRSLYLLIHAYDHTREKTLRRAIEYTLAKSPPHLSEQLSEAYSNSLASGSTVLAEYQRIVAMRDDRLDGFPATEAPKTPDTTQASGAKLGAAALHLREINE